ALQPLRAGAARGAVLRRAPRGAPRILPRPRAHRIDAFRRRAAPARGAPLPRPLAPRHGPRIEAEGRRTFPRVIEKRGQIPFPLHTSVRTNLSSRKWDLTPFRWRDTGHEHAIRRPPQRARLSRGRGPSRAGATPAP